MHSLPGVSLEGEADRLIALDNQSSGEYAGPDRIGTALLELPRSRRGPKQLGIELTQASLPYCRINASTSTGCPARNA